MGGQKQGSLVGQGHGQAGTHCAARSGGEIQKAPNPQTQWEHIIQNLVIATFEFNLAMQQQQQPSTAVALAGYHVA